MGGYTLHPECMLTTMPDGTGVVLHMKHKFYFTLNATAVTVWEALAAKPASPVEDLAAAVAARFEVDVPRARDDVDALLEQLLAEDLILDAR